jgi:uncharacterized protein (UPF0276 family)
MKIRTADAASVRGLLSPFVGLGLRSPHLEEVLVRRPDVAWFEVHPENFMHNPAALASLERVRSDYPVSLHGVALSLGSAGPLDVDHLARLKAMVDRLDPFLVSEHMAWSANDGAHLNDLLPLPCTEEALEVMAAHVDQMQSELGRSILLENPSSYLRFRHSTMGEASFLAELVRRTGCGLLCDVNNIYVSAHNIGVDPVGYLDTLPPAAIGEIHIAGHAANLVGARTILIDDHASRVGAQVWALYGQALRRFGHQPTLIEWDADLPTLNVLLGEAAQARAVADALGGDHHADAA